MQGLVRLSAVLVQLQGLVVTTISCKSDGGVSVSPTVAAVVVMPVLLGVRSAISETPRQPGTAVVEPWSLAQAEAVEVRPACSGVAALLEPVLQPGVRLHSVTARAVEAVVVAQLT